MKKGLVFLTLVGMLFSIGAAAPKKPATAKNPKTAKTTTAAKSKSSKPATPKITVAAKTDPVDDGEKIADFAGAFCKAATTSMKNTAKFFNMEFLLRITATDEEIRNVEEQAKTEGKSLRELIEIQSEKNLENEPAAKSCDVTDTKETACDGLYQMVFFSGNLPESVTQEKMQQVGDNMGIKKCGTFELKVEADGKSNMLFAGRIGDKWGIISMSK
jgi:hypothetical protein